MQMFGQEQYANIQDKWEKISRLLNKKWNKAYLVNAIISVITYLKKPTCSRFPAKPSPDSRIASSLSPH